MKIAFVFNPFSYKLHEENIRIVQKYFGLFPPLSLAWVAAIAEQAGHEAIIVDARTLGLSMDETLGILRKFKPDVIGFMLTTYMFRETMEWARYLKENLKVPVLVGGYNLRVYPEESLMNDVFDYGCYRHALQMVPAFMEELGGKRNFDNVPGLVYKRNGSIIVNPLHPDDEKFDLFPNPARHLLPNELYAEFPTERKNFTVMVTSLGCPRNCIFCEAGGTAYAPRSPETVVSEIRECYTKFGVREIDIFDYEFTAIKKRTEKICDMIVQENLDVIWACRSRIDSVDPQLLKKMHAAGCRRIYFGIERGDQKILNLLNKHINVQQIRDTIRAANEIGIKCLGFFLIGVPGETNKAVSDMVKFSISLGLHYAQFSKLTAKPLTGMWQEMIEKEGKDYWKDYMLGKTEEQQISRPWTSLSNEEIDRLTKWAYLKFYLNIKFLWRSVRAVASVTEFKRKFNALIEMVFNQEKKSEQWKEKGKEFRAYNENSPFRIIKFKRGLKSSEQGTVE